MVVTTVHALVLERLIATPQLGRLAAREMNLSMHHWGRMHVRKIIACLGLIVASVGISPQFNEVSPARAALIPDPVPNQERWPAGFSFAMEIQSAVNDSHGDQGVGVFADFGSVVPNADDGSVDVYWKGLPPKQYFDLEGSEPRPFDIRMHTVANSFAELSIAADEAMKLRGTSAVGYSRIASVAVLPDASGIRVDVTESPLAASFSLESSLERTLQVNVETEYSPPVTSAVATRQADGSPYSGGALIGAGARYCSTGFGVQNKATQLKYILTAFHCFFGQPSPTSVTSFGGSSIIGTWNNSASLNF